MVVWTWPGKTLFSSIYMIGFYAVVKNVMHRPKVTIVIMLMLLVSIGRLLVPSGVALKMQARAVSAIITLTELMTSRGPWLSWLISETVISANIMPIVAATTDALKVRSLEKFIVR